MPQYSSVSVFDQVIRISCGAVSRRHMIDIWFQPAWWLESAFIVSLLFMRISITARPFETMVFCVDRQSVGPRTGEAMLKKNVSQDKCLFGAGLVLLASFFYDVLAIRTLTKQSLAAALPVWRAYPWIDKMQYFTQVAMRSGRSVMPMLSACQFLGPCCLFTEKNVGNTAINGIGMKMKTFQ